MATSTSFTTQPLPSISSLSFGSGTPLMFGSSGATTQALAGPAIPSLSSGSGGGGGGGGSYGPAAPTSTPSLAVPKSSAAGSYTVAKGDTLSAIAAKNGMTLSALLAANPQFQANPNLIKVGQTVTLSGKAAAPATPATPTSSFVTQPKPAVNLHPDIVTPSGTTVNPSTGGVVKPAPTTPAVPTAPTVPTMSPSDVSSPAAPDLTSLTSDEAAAKAYQDAQNMTPEELANEQDINSLTSDFNTKNTATGHQAIPLEFITGQQKNLQEQETNQMNTLQQKAALLQAKRTAAVSASKFALDRADAAVTSARSDAAAAQARADKLASDQAAASKPMAVAPGSTIIDPSTGKPIYSAPSADKTSVVNANGRQLLINTETGQTIQDLGAAPTGGQQDNSIVQTNVHQISGTDSTGKQFSTNFINLTDFPDAASKKQAMQYGADNGIPVLNPAEGEKMVAVTNAYTNIDKIASGVQNLLDKNMGWNIGKGVENTMASFLGNEDIRSFNAWRTAVINNVQALAGGAGSGLRINQAEIDTALKNDLPVISGIGADTVKSATAKLDRLKEQLDSWRGTILDKGNTAGSGGGGSGDALDKALDGIGFKKGSGGTPTATSISAAIRQTESGGNYQAKGASGEYGAYQFTPATWSGWAKQYFGDANAPMTKVNQDKVATAKVQELIDKGYNAQQIALIWNGGTPVAKKGVNSKGVAYDSGAYAKKVLSNLYG